MGLLFQAFGTIVSFVLQIIAMIDKALLFIEKEVNNYFDARFGPVTPKRVSIGNIAKMNDDGNGGGGGEATGLAVLSLVNIEEDRISKNPENFYRNGGGIMYRNPKVLLNLYALFSVTVNTYSTALQTLGNIIQCFQATHYFESATNPNLDPSLEKISMELCSLNFEQVNHLWSILGGKYLPSALYKVRVVAIEDTEKQVGGDLIREIILNENQL